MKIRFSLPEPPELPPAPHAVTPSRSPNGPAQLKDPKNYEDPTEANQPHSIPFPPNNSGIMNPTTTDMPSKPGPFFGPFTQACIRFPIPNLFAEATRAHNMYEALFDTPCITATQRALMISNQPAPFPMLCIEANSNSAIVLHGISVFHPPLGTSHPLAGATLALAGEIHCVGATPCVVILPPETFDDPVSWPASSLISISEADPTVSQLLPPDKDSFVAISWIIPLPPTLVPFFINNANLPLLTVYNLAMQAHDTSDEDTQRMCFHTLQFLQTALTFDPSANTSAPTSQLGLHLDNATMDPVILRWACGQYHIYNMLIGSPTVPIHEKPVPDSQHPLPFPAQHTPGHPAPVSVTNTQQLPNQVIDLTHSEGNKRAPPKIPTQHSVPDISIAAPQANTQHMDMPTLLQAFTNTIATTLHETLAIQHHPPPPDSTLLENSIHDRSSELTGILNSNMRSWSGLTDEEPLPPFWHAFQTADNDGTRTQILDSFLEDAHRTNFHVQYTIRQEFIRDLKNFRFHFPAHIEFLHQGISPFALQ